MCDNCTRSYHAECIDMKDSELFHLPSPWQCSVCLGLDLGGLATVKQNDFYTLSDEALIVQMEEDRHDQTYENFRDDDRTERVFDWLKNDVKKPKMM